jgi:mevalonate kinase
MQQQLDTAMHRKTVLEMTEEELDTHVANMRTRRMASQIAYQEALEAKGRIKQEKDLALYTKRLEQISKKIETANKALDAMEQYYMELKVLRLSLGDEI